MSFCVKKLSVIFIIKKIFKQQLKQQATKVRQWDIKIYSPLKLLLKVLIWYKYKNEIVKHITMMESNNWIFLLKVHIKTYNLSKKKDVLVIHSFYFLCRKKRFTRNEKIQIVYLTKVILKKSSNAIFYMNKGDLDES